MVALLEFRGIPGKPAALGSEYSQTQFKRVAVHGSISQLGPLPPPLTLRSAVQCPCQCHQCHVKSRNRRTAQCG